MPSIFTPVFFLFDVFTFLGVQSLDYMSLVNFIENFLVFVKHFEIILPSKFKRIVLRNGPCVLTKMQRFWRENVLA